MKKFSSVRNIWSYEELIMYTKIACLLVILVYLYRLESTISHSKGNVWRSLAETVESASSVDSPSLSTNGDLVLYTTGNERSLHLAESTNWTGPHTLSKTRNVNYSSLIDLTSSPPSDDVK